MYSCLPRCPVAPADGTGVGLADRTGVGLADRTGVAKIFTFLELEQKYAFFKGLALYKNSGVVNKAL